MPRVPYRYPAAGSDSIADAIRQRRGERGLTPLDGMLLNSPQFANGWNSLLGAVRTKLSLKDDLREAMILRVAVHNQASFEWIQHEVVGRQAGLSTSQLSQIGNLSLNLSHSNSTSSQLRPSILSALKFTDALTTRIKVPDSVFSELKEAFINEGSSENEAENKMVEVTATISTYNMVSRFLVALDVDDRSNFPVPVPESGGEDSKVSQIGGLTGTLTEREEEERGLIQLVDGNTLSTRVYFNSNSSPWLLCINSLLTNLHMWDLVLPSLRSKYNVILYDQRGHGLSSIPKEGSNMHQLADDAVSILDALGIRKLYAVIGVSQGAATTLSFAIRHSERTERIIACDTQAASPEANVKAWNDRIELATNHGMKELADVTVPRWFGKGSLASDVLKEKINRQVSATRLEGFIVGARALQNYDLLKDGLVDTLRRRELKSLLLAGELDGKLPEGLENLKNQVSTDNCQFQKIEKAGHLPMCDNPEEFARVVMEFLSK